MHFIKTDQLVEAVSYNPVLGKKLVKELLTRGRAPEDGDEWYIRWAGEVGAALGDRVSAEKAFEYLKERESSGCRLKAGKIAVALGNIADAEECVSGARASLFKFDLWDRGDLDDLGEIIGKVAKQNMRAAKRMWEYVAEDELVKPALPLVAVRVLEII